MVGRATLDTLFLFRKKKTCAKRKKDFADIRKDIDSVEGIILKYLMKKEIVLVFSDKLEEQILMVAKRLVNKDYAGSLRYFILISFNIDYVWVPKQREVIKKYEDIPRKDLLIFLTALCGNADYLVSNNREFIRKAVNKGEFKCLTPEEFILGIQE